MTTIEQIQASAYAGYFNRLQRSLEADVKALAAWWSTTGVYAYMQIKHDKGFDAESIFTELRQRAKEALNG